MAYEKTTWIDHVEDPITGEVYKQGTPVDAARLNKIEQGIADAIPSNEKGTANGVATLDSNSKIHVSQISRSGYEAVASFTVSAADLNKTITVGSVGIEITLPDNSQMPLQNGVDIVIVGYRDDTKITFKPSGTANILTKSNSLIGKNAVRLFKTSANAWFIEGIYPNTHAHDVTDLTNVVRSKYIFNSSNAYTDTVFPLFPVIKKVTETRAYFNGSVSFTRVNSNAVPIKINILASDFYNSDICRYYCYGDWNTHPNLNVQPCIFTKGGIKYFGLRLKATAATHEHVYFEGECSDWSVIDRIKYYNNNTSTVINQEINESIHYSGNDMALYPVNFYGAPPVYNPAGSQTVYEMLHTGNMGAGSGLDAGLFAGIGPEKYMKFLGSADVNMNLLDWIDTLPIGMLGTFNVASSVTQGVPVSAYHDGIIIKNNSDTDKQIILRPRSVNYPASYRCIKTSVWSSWMQSSDGGNAAMLNGLIATSFDILGQNNRKTIPSGTDFNNLKTSGAYCVSDTSSMATMLNAPLNNQGGYVNILATAGTIVTQIYLAWGSMYRYRVYNGTAWNAWVSLSDGGNADTLDGKHASDLVFAAEKGAPNGVATLDASGKITAAQASATIQSKTASFTLALTNAGEFLQINSAAAVTVTIPANAAVALPVGTELEACRYGAGTVTFAPASGVTLRSVDSVTTIGNQYGCVALKKLATDTWLLSGDLG